jgi:hypothetical protein
MCLEREPKEENGWQFCKGVTGTSTQNARDFSEATRLAQNRLQRCSGKKQMRGWIGPYRSVFQ